MTRRIIYANQLAQSLEYMVDQKEDMIEKAIIAGAILGYTPQVDGFDCTPTGIPSLSVQLANGTLFSNQNVDDTPFGSLPSQIPADTVNKILKSAYSWGNANIAFTPPGTAGFSRNDVIQIEFMEADGSSASIPFFNGFTGQVINPPVNMTENTQRIDSVVISVLAGTAAATGTQVTPTPTGTNIGLWVITTTEGQTQITSGDIARYPNAPFILEKLKDKISKTTADALYAKLADDNVFALPQTIPTIAASVYLSAAQTIPNTNLETLVNFDTVEYDPFGLWDNTNKQFLIAKAGLYQINMGLFCNVGVGNSGVMNCAVLKNGFDYKRTAEAYFFNEGSILAATIFVSCAIADTIKLVCANNTGAGVGVGGAGIFLSTFQIRYAGAI